MSTLLKIDGMTCQNCAHHVREALVKLAGVEGADVDLEGGRARVTGTGLDAGALAAAVTRAGYAAEVAAE
jgi:copper chaperone